MNNKLKLLVVKEDTAIGLKNIITNWKYSNNKYKSNLIPFFIQPYESLTRHSSIFLFNNPIQFINYIDLNKIENSELYSIDFSDSEMDYLKPWIKNSIYLNSFLYGRDFFSKVNESDLISYCKICALYYKKVIENLNPIEFIDIECDNIIRAVLDIICRRFHVKYTVIFNSRIDNYALKANGVLDPFNTKDIKSKLNEVNYIDKYKINIKKYSYLEDEKIFDRRNNSFSIFNALKNTSKQSFYHFKRIKKTIKLNNNFSFELKGLLYGFQYEYIKWLWYKSLRFLFNKNYKSKKNKKFIYDDFKNKQFFYFPLGQIIEGSDPIFSGKFNNDLEALEQAIRETPLTKKLLVKEHRSMIPERPRYQTKYIDSLNSHFLTGKDLVEVNSRINPTRFIKDSLGIISLSGSCLSEGMLFNKPIFIFGKPWLRIISELLGFDPWSKKEAINLFFDDPSQFIIPSEISRKIVLYSINNGFPISLYKLKKLGKENHQNIEQLNQFINFIDN